MIKLKDVLLSISAIGVVVLGYYSIFMSPCYPNSIPIFLIFIVSAIFLIPFLGNIKALQSIFIRVGIAAALAIIGLLVVFSNCSEISITFTDSPDNIVFNKDVVFSGKITGVEAELLVNGTIIEVKDNQFVYSVNLEPGDNIVKFNLKAKIDDTSSIFKDKEYQFKVSYNDKALSKEEKKQLKDKYAEASKKENELADKKKIDEPENKIEDNKKNDKDAELAEKKREEEALKQKEAEEKKRKELEAKRLAEKKKKEEEAKRLAEEQKKKEEEAKRLEEEKKKAEEAKRLAEEEKKRKEAEEKKRIAAEKRKKIEDARKRRIEEARKKEEERKRLIAERKKKKAEEKKRKEEEAKRLAEEKKKKEEAAILAEKKRKEDEEAKKIRTKTYADGMPYVNQWLYDKKGAQAGPDERDKKTNSKAAARKEDSKKDYKYEGQMRNDKANGTGTFIWADGDRYTGSFKDNQKHGKGKYIYINMELYIMETG